MTTDLVLGAYHDGYKERIEALIKSKMKGEVTQVGRDTKETDCQDHDGGTEADRRIPELT